MTIPTSEELFYEQSMRSYDIITRNIESFGERAQKIFNVTSTLIAFLFLIITLLVDCISKNQPLTDNCKLLLICVAIAAGTTLLLFFISLWKFIPILKLQEYKTINTDELYNKYSTLSNIELIVGLTKHINSNNIMNFKKLQDLKFHYKRSLLFTSVGIIVFFVFVLLSIVAFFDISITVHI
jgi:uncharacterized membrane protein YidH (DUF202 family)